MSVRDPDVPVWHGFLRPSAELHDTCEIQAIDATGMDRVTVSHRYATRTKYTFKAVKTTVPVDCKNNIF